MAWLCAIKKGIRKNRAWTNLCTCDLSVDHDQRSRLPQLQLGLREPVPQGGFTSPNYSPKGDQSFLARAGDSLGEDLWAAESHQKNQLPLVHTLHRERSCLSFDGHFHRRNRRRELQHTDQEFLHGHALRIFRRCFLQVDSNDKKVVEEQQYLLLLRKRTPNLLAASELPLPVHCLYLLHHQQGSWALHVELREEELGLSTMVQG